MSANVLPFSQQSSTQIQDTPRPANYRPGVDYLRLNIVDDTYVRSGYNPGVVFIVHPEKIVDRSLHYVELNGYGFMAVLRDDLTSFYITPLDGETPPGSYGRLELDYIGAVIEGYPLGFPGPRWLLDTGTNLDAVFPLFDAVAK